MRVFALVCVPVVYSAYGVNTSSVTVLWIDASLALVSV